MLPGYTSDGLNGNQKLRNALVFGVKNTAFAARGQGKFYECSGLVALVKETNHFTWRAGGRI